MKSKVAKSFIALALIILLVAIAGCLFSRGRSEVSPTPAVITPTPAVITPTPVPGGFSLPDGTYTWVPGPGNTTGDNYTQLFPTPSSQPVLSGTAKDWGTSKDTYARGDMATGWVYVTNTGNVPIEAIDFTIVIKKTVFFIPIEKSYDYSKTGLNIQPGETQRVEFTQPIPSEYSGVSTAGDYQLSVTARLAGNDIGSYSKNMKIV